MKVAARLILSVILMLSAFWVINYLLAFLFKWTIDWSVIWFVLMSVVIFVILRWLVKLLSTFIVAPVGFSDTPIQFKISKYTLVFISWAIAFLDCWGIYSASDFSVTRSFFFTAVAVLVNGLIPWEIHARAQEYDATRKQGEAVANISDWAIKAIKNDEFTYEQVLIQLESMKNNGTMTEFQMRMIVATINVKMKAAR